VQYLGPLLAVCLLQCRGLVQIAASLLLFMEEEDAFWMLCTIIEDLLPASYYSSTLIGVQVPPDQSVNESKHVYSFM